TRLADGFLVGLQIVGGFFLLFLASKAFRALRQPVVSSTVPGENKRFNIFEAALMNALGPGPYIFWATIAGPILLTSWRQSAHLGLGFLFGFYGALIGGFMAFVALFAVAKQLDPRVSRVLAVASALALLGFGLYQLWQGGTAVFTP
ncbi:MAG TPA: LysE family transporter, partial [Chloroflexota bacterium]|nr:LysE family transporter [Chloroflexota bacterium]